MKNQQYVIKSFSKNIDEATDIIESELRSLRKDEVLVRNAYVGINAVYDRELYSGKVPYIDVKFPYTMGVESVGTIIEVGDASNNNLIGKHTTFVKVGSAYQEYQYINQKDVITIPEASPSYLTINPTGISADIALKYTAELKEKETVVISAAAGGLGHILVQLCKMKKCHVVAICGGDRKKKMLQSLNCCDRIIDYKSESINDIINKNYNNKINVGIDSVGRGIFDILLNNLNTQGRLVVIGLAAELAEEGFEVISQPRVYESIYWKGASVRCFMNHLYKEKHRDSRLKLQELYEDKKLQIRIDQSQFFGIESIKEASKYLLSGKSCGKVVVKL